MNNRGDTDQLERLAGVVAEIAHDIRNSLNVILSASQLLDLLPPGDERRTRNLALVQKCTLAMRDQVQDLVDVVRIEAGTFTRAGTSVDIVSLLERLAREWTGEGAGRGVEIRVHLPESGIGSVSGDPDRVRGVLAKALGNAVRAAGSGGWVTVAPEVAPGSVLFTIAHSGPPVPPDHLPSLALKASSSWQDEMWSNKGLQVAAQVVRGLGGEMRVESGPERGNQIRIRLPLLAEAEVS
jgi:histidine kinase